MTKLQPREVGCPTNPNGAHKLLVLHLLGLRFWLFKDFLLLFNNKKGPEPHCNSVQRHVVATSLVSDKLPSPEIYYFHSVCKHSSIFFY